MSDFAWQKISSIELEAFDHCYGGDAPVCAFLTLTYDEKSLPRVPRDTRVFSSLGRNVSAKVFRESEGKVRSSPGRIVSGSLGPVMVSSLQHRDVQLFIKVVRQRLWPTEDRKKANAAVERERLGVKAQSVRYAVCGEYGGKTSRPHYHMLLFGFPHCLRNSRDDQKCRCAVCMFYKDCWNRGAVTAAGYNRERAEYVAKYVAKGLSKRGGSKLFGREPEYFSGSYEPALGDAAVDAEILKCLELERLGVVLDDFPRKVVRGGRAFSFSDRQVNRGRVGLGRPEGMPPVVLAARAAKYADAVAEAMSYPLSLRLEGFRRLIDLQLVPEREREAAARDANFARAKRSGSAVKR